MNQTPENTPPVAPAPMAGTAQPAADLIGDMSPEEREAAAAADQADGLQALGQELERAKAQNAELADQFLRAKAEADNARRRADEEVAKARRFAVDSFAESLLPVVDSLEAGLSVQTATIEQIREGANATLQQLLSALARHKVVPIAPEAGAKFDPHMHQAISLVPADQEANTVVAVLQKGYQMAERVLRPALVTVAAPK